MKDKEVLPGLTRNDEVIIFKVAPTIGAALMGAMMFRGYGLFIGALVGYLVGRKAKAVMLLKEVKEPTQKRS